MFLWQFRQTAWTDMGRVIGASLRELRIIAHSVFYVIGDSKGISYDIKEKLSLLLTARTVFPFLYSSAALAAISFSCTSDGACSYLANVYS